MATQKQIEANRLNSRKSTGPRTPAGKSVSRMNALKTGIDANPKVIRGEDPSALPLLTAEYYDRYQPSTPEQRALVDTLISSDWLRRRINSADRNYHRALKELRQIQTSSTPDLPPQPLAVPTDSQEIGFVPQVPPAAPPHSDFGLRTSDFPPRSAPSHLTKDG
jgi:hypothetical protein